MAKEEEIVVEEAPEEGVEVVLEEEKKEEEAPKYDEEIAQLKKSIEERDAEIKAARERAAQLEKERNEATGNASAAYNNSIQAQENALENAYSSAEQEAAAWKAKYKEALELGDNEAVAEAQFQLSRSINRLDKIEDAKTNFAAWKEQQKQQAEHAAKVAQQAPQISAPSQAWIARHPRVNTDRYYRNVALAASEEAIERGIRPDTQAYFEHIESVLAERFPENKVEEEDEAPPPRKKQFSAPTSREAVSGTKIDGNKIRLTAAEKKAADISGRTYEEYAKNKLELMKEGEIGRFKNASAG